MTPRILLRLALACSLVPLAAGVLIFLAWLPTHRHFLALAGLATIVGGMTLFPIGLLATWVYLKVGKREGADEGVARKGAFAAGMLVMNFSMAATITLAARHLHGECVVTIENESSLTIDRFQVEARIPVGVVLGVPPAERRVLRFRVIGDTGVKYVLDQAGSSWKGIIAGWTDTYMGGDWRVTLRRDGSIQVLDLRR